MEGKKRGRFRKDKEKDKDKEKNDEEDRGEEDISSTEESDVQIVKQGEAPNGNDVDTSVARISKGTDSASYRRKGNETPSSVKTSDNVSQATKGTTAPQTPKGAETPVPTAHKGIENPIPQVSGTLKQVETSSLQKAKPSLGSVLSKVIRPKQSGEIDVDVAVQEEKSTEGQKITTVAQANVTPTIGSVAYDTKSVVGANNGRSGILPCTPGLLKRTPFIHNPPYPEERRERIPCPRTARDYIINLREHLADFQESHGLPRTRDYSFFSLGLALAQETGRAIFSLFHMFTELFPILAIVSLILRFALDKLIEILETDDTPTKFKKSLIFALEMIAIIIPLWILISTIILPLIALVLTILKNMLRIKGNKKTVVVRQKPKPQIKSSASLK